MSNEAFEKWAIDYGLDYESSFTRDDVEAAWQAAKADSESILSEQQNTIAELKAHINDLRETLKQISFYSEIDWIQDNIEQILEKTPAQSLQEHDNEVIEKCAKIAENYNLLTGNIIRALKGK